MRVLVCFVLLVLCAGACCSAPKQKFVYVTLRDGTVQGYSVGPDGHLTALPFTPTRANAPEAEAVAHPDKPIIYVAAAHYMLTGKPPALQAHSTVQPFRVGASGQLTPLPSVTVQPGIAVSTLIVDPKGRFLYVPTQQDKTLVFRVQKNGTLRYAFAENVSLFRSDLQSDGTPLVGAFGYGGMTITPSGHFAYTYITTGFVDHSECRIDQYRLMSKGRLHYLATLGNENQDIGDICVTPDSKYVYIPGNSKVLYNQATALSGIRQYRVRTNGTLAPLSPLLGGKETGGAFVTHDEKRLYAGTENGYTVYRIRANGTLLRLFETPAPPDAATLDPTGNFLYGIERNGDYPDFTYQLVAGRLEPSGRIRPLPPVRFASSTEPVSFALVRR